MNLAWLCRYNRDWNRLKLLSFHRRIRTAGLLGITTVLSLPNRNTSPTENKPQTNCPLKSGLSDQYGWPTNWFLKGVTEKDEGTPV